MNNSTRVRCDVDNCIHNKDNQCNLDILNISSVRFGECVNKTETVCEMFKKD